MSTSQSNQSNQSNELKEKYQEKMIKEFTKFLEVYNKLANTTFSIDVRGEYDIFIKILGNYIYKNFNIKTWDQTKLKFSDEVVIDFTVFINTVYYQPVKNFLLSLKNTFYSSLDDDVYEYLETTKDFTEEEKVICKEFYDKVSALNNAIKHNMFNDINSDVTNPQNIKSYENELKEFNNYTHYISSKREIYALIQHFDGNIRSLSKNKKYDDIFFNV